MVCTRHGGLEGTGSYKITHSLVDRAGAPRGPNRTKQENGRLEMRIGVEIVRRLEF